MTSFAMAEGWIMKGSGARAVRAWNAWREVGAAWALAAALAGALLLTLPSQDRPGAQENLWSLSPAAGMHVHKKSLDAEGPASDESCSDRDYAHELC